MKRTLLIFALCAVLLSGCGTKRNEQYTTTGRYYTNGTLITSDGNIWNYQTETVNKGPVYDGMPVHATFDDNGTETNIYDDTIVELTLDVRTVLCDELGIEITNDFEFVMDDNNIITIKGK